MEKQLIYNEHEPNRLDGPCSSNVKTSLEKVGEHVEASSESGIYESLYVASMHRLGCIGVGSACHPICVNQGWLRLL